MPKEITHWWLAEQAAERLPPDGPLSAVLKAQPASYLLGAVAADSPFYLIAHREAPRAWRAGGRFHDPHGSSYAPLLPLLEPGRPDEAVVALVAGLITHIIADATLHPLIDHLSGPEKGVKEVQARRARTRHRHLETLIDLHHLARGATHHRLGELLARVPRRPLAMALATLFGLDDTALMETILARHARIQGLLDRRWARGLMALASRLPGVHNEDDRALFYPPGRAAPTFPRPIDYHHPVSGAACTESLGQIEERALRAIVAAQESLDSALRGGAPGRFITENPGPNLNTGMVGVRWERMRHFAADIDLDRIAFG